MVTNAYIFYAFQTCQCLRIITYRTYGHNLSDGNIRQT